MAGADGCECSNYFYETSRPGGEGAPSKGNVEKLGDFTAAATETLRQMPEELRHRLGAGSGSRAGGDHVVVRFQVLTKSRIWVKLVLVKVDPSVFLREHGLQITAQRVAVLRAVGGRPHSTAEDIAEEVRLGIGVISRQAVYDSLNLLVQKGLVRRIQPAGSPALYEDRVNDNHHHMICRGCGKTADVDCAVGVAPCLSVSGESGFRIDEAEVIYWGTCPDCLAKR